MTAQAQAPASGASATTLLVIWHAHDSEADPLTARVTAAALQTVLTRVPGITVSWRDGDAYAADAWCALLLQVAPDALPNLAATLNAAGARIDALGLVDALQRARQQDGEAQASAASRIDVAADRLARERLLGSASAQPSAQAASSAARALGRAAPFYVTLD